MPGTADFIRVAARRRQVAARYLRGEYQSQIAQDLGLTQAMISMDLKAIRAEWLRSSLRDFDAVKSEQLAKIDQVEMAAWEGWHRSLAPREITITEATEGERMGRKATIRKEQQIGDPRFLAEIGKCVDRRCSILGIGAQQDALKSLGLGLAGLLEEARQWHAAPPLLPQPRAEA